MVLADARPIYGRADTFTAGAYILPSDTVWQDDGGFSVYGLLNALLLGGVEVQWTIAPGKAKDGVDFTAETTELGTFTTPTLRDYAGGSWVIAAIDAPAAFPIIDAWQTLYPQVVIHEATDTFIAPVERTLVSAPPIAVTVDGKEDIAFGYLNAAGITDSLGQAWPNARDNSGVYPGVPHILTPAEIIGSLTSDNDGELFTVSGYPRYVELDVMHYDPNQVPVGLIPELRSFLAGRAYHLFLECAASRTFEQAAGGAFLSTTGIVNGGNPGGTYDFAFMDEPIAQHHGDFAGQGGSVRSVQVQGTGSYRAGVKTLIKKTGVADGDKDILVFGQLDGVGTNGFVTFLAGHEYATDTPLSTNDEAPGVRFYLNGLFISEMLQDGFQPNFVITLTAPASTLSTTITLTIDYVTGPDGVAFNAALTDTLPPGATFVSATGGGSYDAGAGTVTWPLGDVPPNSAGSVTVTFDVPGPGSYTSSVMASWFAGLTPQQTSATLSTSVVDVDADGDGFGSLVDCDDGDATVYPPTAVATATTATPR